MQNPFLKKIILSVASVAVFSLPSCYQAKPEVPVQTPSSEKIIVDAVGPCSESGVSQLEFKEFDNGFAYRKCWSSKIQKFATEIYKDRSNVFIYMIPTLPPADKEDRYSPVIDQMIKKTIIQ